MLDRLAPLHLGLSAAELAFVLAVVTVAGFMRGFTGFGFAMLAVPLMALVVAPARAVPFVIVVQLFAGAWDWREGRQNAHWPSIPWLLLGALAGTPLGTVALTFMNADWARLAIAASLVIAVVVLGRGSRLAAVPGRGTLVAIGLVAGVLNGVAAMPGPPVILLYLAGPFAVEIGRASLLTFFAAANIVGAVSATVSGLIVIGTVIAAAAAFPLMLLAQSLGRRAFVATGARMHRPVALGFVALLAALTAARAALAIFGTVP